MEMVAAELAAVLAARGPDGALIYSERDVSIAISILSALEGGEPGPAARAHLERVRREADPPHPALLRQLQRILRRTIAPLADKRSARAVGADWPTGAPRRRDLEASRGGVLAFRLEQGRDRK